MNYSKNNDYTSLPSEHPLPDLTRVSRAHAIKRASLEMFHLGTPDTLIVIYGTATGIDVPVAAYGTFRRNPGADTALMIVKREMTSINVSIVHSFVKQAELLYYKLKGEGFSVTEEDVPSNPTLGWSGRSITFRTDDLVQAIRFAVRITQPDMMGRLLATELGVQDPPLQLLGVKEDGRSKYARPSKQMQNEVIARWLHMVHRTLMGAQYRMSNDELERLLNWAMLSSGLARYIEEDIAELQKSLCRNFVGQFTDRLDSLTEPLLCHTHVGPVLHVRQMTKSYAMGVNEQLSV